MGLRIALAAIGLACVPCGILIAEFTSHVYGGGLVSLAGLGFIVAAAGAWAGHAHNHGQQPRE